MNDKKTVFLLILTILFFLSGLGFFLDYTGIMQMSEYLPFMREKNEKRVEDSEYPTEVEKMNYRKWEEKLISREEKLAEQQAAIDQKQKDLQARLSEVEELKKSIEAERKKLLMMTKDFTDRQKKIQDLASKVTNMPPEKATEMMQNWRDFDIIEVLRQIDKDAEREGRQSISPYLLTLFSPERRAEITRKMLLPPLEQSVDSEPGTVM